MGLQRGLNDACSRGATGPRAAKPSSGAGWSGAGQGLQLVPQRVGQFHGGGLALAGEALDAPLKRIAQARAEVELMAEAVAGNAGGFDLMASLPQPRFPGGAALRWPLLVLAMTWYSMRDRLGL